MLKFLLGDIEPLGQITTQTYNHPDIKTKTR